VDLGPIALTEKMLSSAGGWQAMKTARDLLRAGAVSEVTYEPPLLAGLVQDRKKYHAGLRVRSATDLENICTCRESREWGKICAHSISVGLAHLSAGRPASALSSAEAKIAPQRFFPIDQSDTVAMALHFILPPNFLRAWASGQVMLCIEAETSERRMMLDAWPADSRAGLDPTDLAIVERLAHSSGVMPAGMNIVSAKVFLELLPFLRRHPRATFGRSTPARIAEEIHRPVIRISRGRAENFTAACEHQPNDCFLVAETNAWLLRENEFYEIGRHLPVRLTNVFQGPIQITEERAPEFFAFEFPRWREVAEVLLPNDLPMPQIATAQPEFILKLEGSLTHLRAALSCRYADRPAFSPTSSPADQFVVRDATNPQRFLVRNFPFEVAAVARLEAAGFVNAEMRDSERAARFFAFDYPQINRDWTVLVTPRLENARETLEPIVPVIEIAGSGEDWFEFKLTAGTSGGEQVSLGELQRLLRAGRSSVKLKNGRQAVFDPDALDDFEQLLRDANPRQPQPGLYQLKKIQAGYLASTAAEIGAKLIDAARALSAECLTSRDLGPLAQQLRDYQAAGVAWLAALAEQKLGGILADEMGLGKTVQTLALLQLRRGQGAALVVCPTSLLANWEREAKRFTPDLRVLAIDGADRAEKIARLPQFDLGLTSYGLLRRDADLYAGLIFDSVILDEAQHIKNPETQNAQAAFKLRARQRFVLTGTPMENSVRDLWSLMHFVAPGYLGSRRDFAEQYEKPLARGAEPAVQRRLARRLRPFLLRRRKSEVARELPEKIVQVVPCELGQTQRATYDALLREIQQAIGGRAPNDGARRMQMLTGLLRLRQACCDLRLLGISAPHGPAQSSAKLDLLDELVAEIVDGGHRVLIFSQFVKMLELVRQRLELAQIRFCYLHGGTRDRMREVETFQNDAAIPVFLISLKAGGVGLNLAAADTVIHFDPWWNAAAEAQATDRAHRIGQTRVVTSYKLIARDTVEEKILRLQERKRELAAAIIESEDSPLMTGLTTAELEELLG
jgi:superfamily II DNA or RNA helicase